MGLGAFLFMVKYGTETQFGFQISEGGFHPGNGHIVFPDLGRT